MCSRGSPRESATGFYPDDPSSQPGLNKMTFPFSFLNGCRSTSTTKSNNKNNIKQEKNRKIEKTSEIEKIREMRETSEIGETSEIEKNK